MAKVDADAELRRRRARWAARRFDDALAAARQHVEATGATFVHAFEDARRDRRARERSGSSSPSRCRDAGRSSCRSAAAGWRRASRSRCVPLRPGSRLVGVQGRRSEQHDRGRDRGQAPGRAGRWRSSAARSTRWSRSRTRRSPRRSCSCSSGRSSSSRARARSASRRCSRAGSTADGPVLRAALGRQHRRDAADVGRAPRAVARRAATSSSERACPTGPASSSSCSRSSPRRG